MEIKVKKKALLIMIVFLVCTAWKLQDEARYHAKAETAVSKVNNINLEIKEGTVKNAMVTMDATNVLVQGWKWTSNNKAVATVNAEGIITAIKVGTSKVTATSTDASGKKVIIMLKVYSKKRIVYRTGFYYEPISSEIKARILGKSYKKNKNIGYSDLRYVKVKYVNYSGKIKTGELIVNKAIAKDMVEIFYQLYVAKYPIAKMVLVDEYKADDEDSMEANNTSAFNYRVMDGTNTLSQHAYGLAIDINPVQNPYVSTRQGKLYFSPSNARKYVNRTLKSKGMIIKNDLCYKLFKKHGFVWGAEIWKAKDYQHFHKVIKK